MEKTCNIRAKFGALSQLITTAIIPFSGIIKNALKLEKILRDSCFGDLKR